MTEASDPQGNAILPTYDTHALAGSKRKGIEFVPATTATSSSPSKPASSSRSQNLYLSIVLPESKTAEISSGLATAGSGRATKRGAAPPTDADEVLLSHADDAEEERATICSLCNTPIASITDLAHPHESSLPHQLALQHSYPPSSLDRRRKGFKYLASYGWDPDQRKGLGVQGGGRLDPIRAYQNEGKWGIGVDAEQRAQEKRALEEAKRDRRERGRMEKGEKRRGELERERRGKRMEQLLFGRDDVNKFLGIEF